MTVLEARAFVLNEHAYLRPQIRTVDDLREDFAHWPGAAFDAAVDELVARGLFEEHGSGRLIVWPWSGVTG